MTPHRYGFRFAFFALIGGLVFVAGLGLQVMLVRYANIGVDWSYAAQAIFSIELSYLLNRYLTWRDRSAGFWAAAWKFNAQKLLMTVINLAAYALLVRAGMEYIVANVVLTAIFTPVNYFASDLLVFVHGKHSGAPEHTVEPRLPKVLPTVSVVIPCKGSERTIRATVDSFLRQDYPVLSEVILVGDVNDSTWEALADVADSRLVLLEQERTPGRRDPNVKRDKGIRKSAGDVIALADSDIVVDPGWLGRAVGLLFGQGGGLVAGGIRSINDTFWGRFVDNNVLAAKTPRVQRPYRVTAQNFGARGCKPPITANAVFTRELYDCVQLDTAWAYGYEDYEWFWRMARQGHPILFASELTASHHHRRSFRHLVREYHQSAHGCAQFIRAHPDSPLARKRAAQAFGLPTLALGALALAALAVASGHGVLVAGLLAMAAVVVTGREVARSRSLEGVTYAPAALALGGVYAATIAGNLMRPAIRRVEAPTWDDSTAESGVITLDRPPEADEPTDTRGLEAPSRHRSPRRHWMRRICWPLLAILAAQTGLALTFVWSNTAFSDEGLYLWAGHLEIAHWLHGAPLPNLTDYFSGAPMVYSPLGAMADSIGGLAAARLLSLVFMMGATTFQYLAVKRMFGRRTALIAAGLWVASEPALKLSAFATYDAMSVSLMALAAWIAIESCHRKWRGELIVLTAALLTLASVTAYSYAIYVPALIMVAVLYWAGPLGGKRAVVSGAWLSGATLLGIVVVSTVLKLWPGIEVTVLARAHGTNTAMAVIAECWSLAGIPVALGLLAICVSVSRRNSYTAWLVVALTGAGTLVPFEQARIQSMVNVDKHMSLGIWFASIAAAWGISHLVAVPKGARMSLMAAGAVAALTVPLASAWSQTDGNFTSWQNTKSLNAALASLMPKSGPVLVENAPLSEYYLQDGSQWSRWTNISSDNVIGHANSAQLLVPGMIKRGVFDLVALDFRYGAGAISVDEAFNEPGPVIKQALVRSLASSEPAIYQAAVAIEDNPEYRIVAVGPWDTRYLPGAYVIWLKTDKRASTGRPS